MQHRTAIGFALLWVGALGCRPAAPVVTPRPAEAAAGAVNAPGAVNAAPLDDEAKMRARQAEERAKDDALRAHFACPTDGPEILAARGELTALDAAIEALGDLDDPAPFSTRIDTLLESPCLALARQHAIPLLAESGLALRLWRERGGIAWLEDALEFAEGGSSQETFPPTMPITLSLETHPEHPLAPWLCGLHDEACAATTAGWRARGQQVMGRNEHGRHVLLQLDDLNRCEDEALEYLQHLDPSERDPAEPYKSWARCMFEAEGDNTEFPLGGLRAPEAGWLVVEGRRGHYSFCDELHAYELETGAAHVVRSCAGLEFSESGSVDEQAIADDRRLRIERGAVPRDNVRELAFMLLVADHVRHPSIPQATTPAWGPRRVERPTTSNPLGIAELAEWGGSNQTALSWRFVPPTGPAIEGHLSWPPGYNRAPKKHAAKLLVVVEEGIAPGCPPRALPATLPLSATLSGVSGIDASPEALDDSHHMLVGALQDQVRCKSGKR
jgi:hypothetical protein